MGYCTANAPLGSTAALVVVVVGSDDEHDDSRELASKARQPGRQGRKGSKVDDLTKVQLSLTNCPVRGLQCTP